MSLKHNPALFLNLSVKGDCLVQGAVEGGVPEGVCGDLDARLVKVYSSDKAYGPYSGP